MERGDHGKRTGRLDRAIGRLDMEAVFVEQPTRARLAVAWRLQIATIFLSVLTKSFHCRLRKKLLREVKKG